MDLQSTVAPPASPIALMPPNHGSPVADPAGKQMMTRELNATIAGMIDAKLGRFDQAYHVLQQRLQRQEQVLTQIALAQADERENPNDNDGLLAELKSLEGLLVDKLSADECAVLSGGVDEMQRHIENEIKEKCAEIDALDGLVKHLKKLTMTVERAEAIEVHEIDEHCDGLGNEHEPATESTEKPLCEGPSSGEACDPAPAVAEQQAIAGMQARAVMTNAATNISQPELAPEHAPEPTAPKVDLADLLARPLRSFSVPAPAPAPAPVLDPLAALPVASSTAEPAEWSPGISQG